MNMHGEADLSRGVAMLAIREKGATSKEHGVKE